MKRAGTPGRRPPAQNRQSDLEEAMIGHVVELFIKGYPAFATNPLGDWEELAGGKIARYCQPRSLKNRVLTVTAHDSVWKYHLELLKDILLEKINKGRSEPLVEKIVVRVGELSATAPQINPALQDLDPQESRKTHPLRRKKTPSRSLTPEEKELLKALPDPDLRAMGTRLLKRIPIENG